MNKNQLLECQTLIKSLLDIDIQKKIKESYPSILISAIQFNELSAPLFITTYNRVIKQFQSEFSTNEAIFLPIQYQHSDGKGPVNSILSALLNEVTLKNWPQAETYLIYLVQYQKQNSFYDRSRLKVHNIDELKVHEIKDQFQSHIEDLKSIEQEQTILIKQLGEEKEKTISFLNQKKQELEEIRTNHQQAQGVVTQINTLLNQSTSTHEQINSIKSIQEERLNEVKKIIDEYNSEFKAIKLENLELQSQFTYQLEELISKNKYFENQLSFVDSKKSFFEERENYLKDLIGREVGVSLFETFEKRKSELKKPVNAWTVAVILVSIICTGYIIAIFTSFFHNWNPVFSWESIAINALKTSPAFILLGFTISQYIRERNYQEEYAFKSAVALTVKSYVDLIESPESKDNLIMTAVLGVYQPPTGSKNLQDKKDYLSQVILAAQHLIPSKNK